MMNSYLEIQKVIGTQKMESQSRHAMLLDVPMLNGEKIFFVKVTCQHVQNYLPKANVIYRIKLRRNELTCDTVSSEHFQYLHVKNFRINTDYSERANTLEIHLIVKSKYNIMFNHFMLFDYNTNEAVFEMKKFELADDAFIPAKYFITFYNKDEDFTANDH